MAVYQTNGRIGTLYGRQDTRSTASSAHGTSDNAKQQLNERIFRESAVTILMVQRLAFPETFETGDDTISISDCDRLMKKYWTTLILTPTGFYPGNVFLNMSPIDDASLMELYIIVRCLSVVESRRVSLLRYFDGLLDEDFMDSEAYTRLIFDDDTLTRSRLYFWTISCLNEFIASLDDTQKQWKFFREARIDPVLSTEAVLKDKTEDSEEMCERIQVLLKEGERFRQGLEDIQAEFRAKIGMVQTLRDGLFNASALIESRSSTRLGQNVQLLTYISIFYLPLGFCAALWAVPNIDDNKTRIPFVITTSLVCLITFVVVFNLNNIANALGKTYFSRRQRLVDEMKDDPNSEWHERRQWFEEFPPNSDRKGHSEWWIVRYQFSKWFRWRKNGEKKKKSAEGQP